MRSLTFFQTFGCVALLLAAPYALCRVVPSPSDCTPTEHWVSPHTKVQRGRAVNVSGHCRTNPAGYGFWRPLLRDARPDGWPHAKERSKPWKTDEIEKIVDALSVLPDQIMLKTIKGIHRMDKSVVPDNPASWGNGYIALYDSAFVNTAELKLSRMLAHELAHELFDRHLSGEDRKDYGYRLQRECCYVEPDGKISPDEDFANNIEYFLFDSKTLERMTPHAARWIKKRFGDNFKLRARR